MTVAFINEGLIDRRAISTMGVNVKEGENPIGFFGTGLKYGLATLLRLECHIVLYIGTDFIRFRKKKVVIRGKDFEVIMMDDQELPFVTEMGKNWEAWMAYRELYCNALDEGGYTTDLPEGAVYTPKEGHTAWIVTGKPIDDAHAVQETFLIPRSRKPRLVVPNVLEVYDGGSDHLFYRGIRAGDVPYGSKSLFTYNVIRQSKLTEDRTLDYPYEVLGMVRDAAVTCNDGAFLTQVLTSREDEEFESHLAYESTSQAPSETFIRVLEQLREERATDIQDKALNLYSKHTSKKIAPNGRVPTDTEQSIITQAQEFLDKLELGTGEATIRVADHLGRGTLALVVPSENIIVLSTEILQDGVRHVAQGLMEEAMHLRTGYGDRTRQLQTHLFKQLMRLGELVTGEELSFVTQAEAHADEQLLTKPAKDEDDNIPF